MTGPVVLPSFVKINLTLRVHAGRADGYHDLTSLFWRRGPVETLTLTPRTDDNGTDSLSVTGESIDGPNIVTTILERIRTADAKLPFFDLALHKIVPPGSGLGAGSGNGAALLSGLAGWDVFPANRESLAGADGFFLGGSADLALVQGLGERIYPMVVPLPYRALVAIPNWSTSTVEAYRNLDRMSRIVMTPRMAEDEALEILSRLGRLERVGRLPNDFLELLMGEHARYGQFFDWCATNDAVAWGLTGSGSAMFGLWPIGVTIPFGRLNGNWVEKFLIL